MNALPAIKTPQKQSTLLVLVMLLTMLAVPTLQAQKIRIDERAAHGVSQTYHQDRYFMAWAGESNRLYIMRSDDGVDWRAKIALDERSGHAPDIASDGDYLYLIWTGESTNDLYVMRSLDGIDWGGKVRLDERSNARPAITGGLGGPMLIAWKGEQSNKIHILRSEDGVDWRAKIALDEETLNGPTLGVYQGSFFLSWTGVSANHLYVMRSEDGVDWRAKIRLDEQARKAPSLAGFDGRLYLAWQGASQGDVYVMQSDDGVDWRSKQRLDERTLKSLKLTGGERLSLTFQGETSNNIYNLLIRKRTPVPIPEPEPPPVQAEDDRSPLEKELDDNGRATLTGIYFDYDSANLRSESEPTLNTVLNILQKEPDAQFIFEGHTSSEGTDRYNMALSQRRAQAVVNWLMARGISAGQIGAEGYGESRPVAVNDTPDGRSLNRRVEIVEKK